MWFTKSIARIAKSPTLAKLRDSYKHDKRT